MTKLHFGSAASLAVLASALAGCAAPHANGVAKSSFVTVDSNMALATRALSALNAGNSAQAVELAERAVAKSPTDAGYRALLGNAYFSMGRFWSAESAFKDSLALHSNQPQVILRLALAQIALGKKDEAAEFLTAGRDVLDPSDYGLALALAGRAAEALATLEPAARSSAGDPRVRQNLALAYALAGDWTNARIVAGQDVPADQLDARIAQWMQLAGPSKPGDQVAALIGVSPATSDQGQPIRLALRQNDGSLAVAQSAPPAPIVEAPVAVAQNTLPPAPAYVGPETPSVPQPQIAEIAPVAAPTPTQVAEVAPLPAPPVAQEPASTMSSILSFAAAVATAPETAAALPAAMPRKAAAKPAKIRKAAAPAKKSQFRAGTSNSVVQLGAYKSPQAVTQAWTRMTQRYPALRAYLPMRARFDSAKGTFWRLSIQGFNSQREAIARCETLKSRGGSCFVRRFAGDTPVQYASR